MSLFGANYYQYNTFFLWKHLTDDSESEDEENDDENSDNDDDNEDDEEVTTGSVETDRAAAKLLKVQEDIDTIEDIFKYIDDTSRRLINVHLQVVNALLQTTSNIREYLYFVTFRTRPFHVLKKIYKNAMIC